MRDDLHGFPEIIAPSFFFDDRLVDPARSDIICLGGWHVQKPFIMAEIEVGFSAIFRDIALAVFIGVKSPRIDVDIGVKLLDCHRITAGLEQFSQ